MRSSLRSLIVLALSPAALLAQEGSGTRTFMQPDTGLMVWTLVIFVILMFVLSRYAFGPITAAVEAREKALEEAIEGAKRDRDAAAKLLQEWCATASDDVMVQTVELDDAESRKNGSDRHQGKPV